MARRVLLRLLCLLLAAGLLTGCVRYSGELQTGIPDVQFPGRQTPPPTLLPDDTLPASADSFREAYGSAGLLAWPCVLYSIYLDSPYACWTDEQIALTQRRLAEAADWITEQAGRYNASPRLYYDTGDGRLSARVTCTTPLDADNTSGDAFYDYVDTLTAAVDTDALRAAYGTAGIGYLIFLPFEGCSYSILHYLEDGENYLNEFSCLYLYDPYVEPGTPESPAVYAHEILHLFGAADLYEGSSDPYVTPELAAYVAQTWPDAIMYDTYNADGTVGGEEIDKSLCPLTAFRLGLCDRFPGMERFPDATADPPGVYTMEGRGAGNWETGQAA
ncbi:MAG: hypothetical protein U0L91_00030 [Gemmiger sp.]|uniref:hypothetical protein n=1 Tax=Gemmiger sp. TaxID=2049027 RepID=UPI002E76B61D|nr:hypothetical protein [Gemmiger sp.]MEE0799646.1 hypothetical protein [Gemmiger sp.]